MKSAFGLSENGAAALSYVLGPVTGIAMLIMERENKYVRFHALQSTLWFLMLWIMRWIVDVVSMLPIIGGIIGFIISPLVFFGVLIAFASKILLILKAYKGETFKIPIIGDVVLAQVNKG